MVWTVENSQWNHEMRCCDRKRIRATEEEEGKLTGNSVADYVTLSVTSFPALVCFLAPSRPGHLISEYGIALHGEQNSQTAILQARLLKITSFGPNHVEET